LITYLYIAQIILAVALIAIVIVQAKGSSMGGVFGGDSAVYKTRRGMERTLFNATIGLAAIFFLFALLSVILTK
jgi:preprotein translocase subunit SecG